MVEIYKKAYNDFILGEGNGKLSVEYCEILIKHNEIIGKQIMKFLNLKKKSVSVLPYGDQIQFVIDPVFFGYYTTSVEVKNDTHSMIVYFDRN